MAAPDGRGAADQPRHRTRELQLRESQEFCAPRLQFEVTQVR
ncbi:hypothetical protein N3K63_02295 [Microbacterium sp. W1N]|nr:hypothetical protein [Microbacterium festucae]MCT9819111.1 hypothetical protein [Microbacterium festucae]